MNIIFTENEYGLLCQQDPASKDDGGYQSLLVGLQQRTNEKDLSLELSAKDIERIHRYAFDYNQGGWQERLKAIFGRTLGQNLDGKNV